MNKFGKPLIACPQLPLVKLYASDAPSTITGLCQTLSVFSHTLLELGLFNIELTTTVVNVLVQCIQLQALEITMDGAPGARLTKLLTACKHLSRLSMQWQRSSKEEVSSVLAARQQHMPVGSTTKVYWLSKYRNTINFIPSVKDFADIVEQYPWTVDLQVGKNQYYTPLKLLLLQFSSSAYDDDDDDTDNRDLDRIKEACAGFQTVRFSETSLIRHARMHNTSVHWKGPPCAANIVELCLTELEVYVLSQRRANFDKFDVGRVFGSLGSIAMSCPNIQHLALPCSNVFPVFDDILIAVLTNCPKLEVLKLGAAPLVTVRTLMAILDTTVGNLQLVTWEKAGFNVEDVQKFKQLARERGLTSLPKLHQSTRGYNNSSDEG